MGEEIILVPPEKFPMVFRQAEAFEKSLRKDTFLYDKLKTVFNKQENTITRTIFSTLYLKKISLLREVFTQKKFDLFTNHDELFSILINTNQYQRAFLYDRLKVAGKNHLERRKNLFCFKRRHGLIEKVKEGRVLKYQVVSHLCNDV